MPTFNNAIEPLPLSPGRDPVHCALCIVVCGLWFVVCGFRLIACHGDGEVEHVAKADQHRSLNPARDRVNHVAKSLQLPLAHNEL